MDHNMSSDDDLPDVGSMLSGRAEGAYQRSYNRQTEPIVLSESDSDSNVQGSDLASRLMQSNMPQPSLKRQASSTRKDFYSSGSDSESNDGPSKPKTLPIKEGYQQDVLSVRLGGGVVPETSTATPNKKKKKRTPEEIAETKSLAEVKKLQREEEKLKKKREKEEKARVKDLEAAKKKFQQESKKAARPTECLKHLMVMIDPELVKRSSGARILGLISERDQRFEVQQQPHPNLISFWREVLEGKEMPGNQFEVTKKEVVEDQLLLWLSVEEFTAHVHAQKQEKIGSWYEGVTPLRSFIQGLQKKLEDRKVTIIVQGLQKYYREQKVASARGRKNDPQSVSRVDVEETLVDIQFTTGCNIRFTETDEETAKLVLHYTKAVAEAPFKKDRCNTDMNIHIDTSTCVKIDPDGNGVTRAWRQIIQIFRSIGAEVANAILAEYPTPRALYEAYGACATEKEAIRLLENIVVRRGYGVMETNRRVGKELAKKLFTLFTTTEPDITLR